MDEQENQKDMGLCALKSMMLRRSVYDMTVMRSKVAGVM